MAGFIWWMIIGLVAGAIARFLVPGRQPMGIIMTMVLGMIGSLVAGFIASIIFKYDPAAQPVNAYGLIASTIGAVIVLGIYVSATQPRVR